MVGAQSGQGGSRLAMAHHISASHVSDTEHENSSKLTSHVHWPPHPVRFRPEDAHARTRPWPLPGPLQLAAEDGRAHLGGPAASGDRRVGGRAPSKCLAISPRCFLDRKPAVHDPSTEAWAQLHAACCMLHAACCMLHAACCMLHAACCMLHSRALSLPAASTPQRAPTPAGARRGATAAGCRS